MSDARKISLMVIFSVISIVLDSMITPGFSSGIWYGWIFIMSPISGIILGPRNGFLTTLISVMIGHMIIFRDSVFEFIFTFGAPLGSAIAGMFFREKKLGILFYYTTLLTIYFLTPLGRGLPIWGMWDIYVVYIILLFSFLLEKLGKFNNLKNQRIKIALSTIIGLEADILFRVFVLIPGQGYSLYYGLTPEALTLIWSIPAPLITPFKVIISVSTAIIVVPAILTYLNQNGFEVI